MRSWTGLFVALLATISSASAGEFGPSVEGEVVLADAAGLEDVAARGGCSSQYLKEGVQLPDLPLFYTRVVPDSEWGTVEMVDVLIAGTRHMRWVMPESSVVLMGDISHKNGGFFDGHKSHRGGIDADVGIYKTGAWMNPRGFENLSPSEFDVEANWMLMSSFLDTGKVDMILLDRGHIARLKAYTLSAGLLTKEEAERIFPEEGSRGSWSQSGIVRHAPGHTGHMHVRVLCADGSKAD